MSVLAVFEHRFRGFRVVEIGGVGVLLALALIVYLAKTSAGGERADIDHVQDQITDEQSKIAILRAEVADLEQPSRLENLSDRYLKLAPIAPNHEIDAQALTDIARPSAPDAKSAAAPVVIQTAAASAQPDSDDAAAAAVAPRPAPAAIASHPPVNVNDSARAKPKLVKVAAVASPKPQKLAALAPAKAKSPRAARPAADDAIGDILTGEGSGR